MCSNLAPNDLLILSDKCAKCRDTLSNFVNIVHTGVCVQNVVISFHTHSNTPKINFVSESV